MGKPRVILADRDENYISPLLMKFIEELQDGIELEVITDEQYFNELFAKPQSAGILIISEDLYDRNILKHDIRNIFILTEEQTEDQDLGVVKKIFKYSSLKEIFSKIMAASSQLKIDNVKPKDTSVILVYSASGGTGKTTIALGISMCMAQNFKRVLYVSADRLSTFQYYLEDRTPLPQNVYAGIAQGRSNMYYSIKPFIRNERFDYIPPFGASLSSLNVDYGFYENVIRAAAESKDYDVIVVDTDQVLDAAKSKLVALSEKVLIVTGKTRESIFAANLMMKSMDLRDSEKYYFICNDTTPDRIDSYEDDSVEKNYLVDEKVGYIRNIDRLSLTDLGHQGDIQKISFLII